LMMEPHNQNMIVDQPRDQGLEMIK